MYSFFKIIASFLSLFLLMSVPTVNVPHSARDSENCKMNFAVMSDVHMESNNKASRDVFIRILQDIKNDETGVDGLFLLGDNTMNGQHIENMYLYGILSRQTPDLKVYTALGNHDTGNGVNQFDKLSSRFWDHYNSYYGENPEKSSYYYKVMNGCYFIFMGTESDAINSPDISREQILWVDGLLAQAEEQGAPAFIFNHYPYFYFQENNALMLEVLTKHTNEIFYFSGHTHTDNVVYRDLSETTHYFNLPRCTEYSMNTITGEGLMVELYEEQIVVRIRSFYTSQWGSSFTFKL